MWELVDVLPLPLPAIGPADAGHVGDRILAGEEFAVLEPRIHHPVEPVDLIHEASDRVGNRLAGVILEVVHLPRHRAEPAHLPEQPLLHLDACALVARIELAGLAAEILQDCAGLEDRDRPPSRPGGIDAVSYTHLTLPTIYSV